MAAVTLFPAGVQHVSPPLTGNEKILIEAGGALKADTTTAAIAALASSVSTAAVLTTLSTVGNGSLTAAALIGREISRTGVQTGAFTDTTVAASAIIAALPAGAPVGTSWKVTISNNQTGASGYVETIAGGTGVTVSGISTIPTGDAVDFFITLATASTITMVGRLSGSSVSTSIAVAGATSGQVTINPPAVAGAAVLTLPPNAAGTLASTSGANLLVEDVYRCTTAQTANANVTPANITGLSGAVAVGTYDFEASIFCTIASGTGGIAINQALTTAVLGVCNFQAMGFTASAVAVQTTTTATSGTVLFTQAAVVLQIIIKGSFTVTTAGTFALQMCQSASNASNSVVNVGSTMRLTRIA